MKNSERILVWKAADFRSFDSIFYGPCKLILANQTTFDKKYPFTWFFHDDKNNLASLHCICELLNPFVRSLRVPIKVRSRFQFQVWHFNCVQLWINTDKKYSKIQNKIHIKGQKSVVLKYNFLCQNSAELFCYNFLSWILDLEHFWGRIGIFKIFITNLPNFCLPS